MLAPASRRIARFAAASAIAATGFFGIAQAAHAQSDPYPTVTTATTQPTEVSASTIEQGETTTTMAVSVDDSDLARTGSDSGKMALIGLAALGAGGVCVSAARRRGTN